MNHYKKALEEGDKLFDDRFLDGKGEMFGRLVPCVWNSKSEIKSFLTQFTEKIRQAVAEDDVEWVENGANFHELMIRAKHSIGGKLTARDIWALSFGVNYFRDRVITHKREQLTKE